MRRRSILKLAVWATLMSVVPAGWAMDKGSAEAEQSFIVLCYHRFCDPLKEGEKAPSDYHLPLDEFEWQMGHLKKEGIVPISQTQLNAYWKGEGKLPEKAVLLTFDDGFESVYTKAYPVLKKFGYPGVLFLYTDFIGWKVARDKAGRKGQEGEGALSLGQVREMTDLLALESHTKGHPNLGREAARKGKAYGAFLEGELREPLRSLREWFGREAAWLAYPFGVYNPKVLEEAGKAGYELAFTVNPGPNDRTVPALSLKRNLLVHPVKRTGFMALFGTKVLHLERAVPEDGEVLPDGMPEVKGTLLDEVDPSTLTLSLNGKPLKAVYDPASRTFSHRPGTPWRSGGHMLTVKATDLKGQKRENTWYFRVELKERKN